MDVEASALRSSGFTTAVGNLGCFVLLSLGLRVLNPKPCQLVQVQLLGFAGWRLLMSYGC